SLNRKGLTATNAYGDIDMLSYSYQGNQLTSVSDAIGTNFTSTEHFQDGFTGTDYSYDALGNMTGDLNRSILVGYNHLNKPTYVEKGANEGITYIYAADGTKLRQKVHDFSSAPMGRLSNSQSQVLDPNTVTKITDYVGPYQYEDADGNATQVDKQLIQFQHAKGRATRDGSEIQPHRSSGKCKSGLPRRRQGRKSQSRSHRRAGCCAGDTGLLSLWDESFGELCDHDFSRKSVSLQWKRKAR
ncbi:MAG: hypothetical protein AAFQ92_24720, partial [Bacteroidota bacterium]